MRYLLSVVLVTAVALGGCGGGEKDDMDLQQKSDERAVQTRGYVDDLVDRLGGTGVDVTEDGAESCDPERDDSGLVHNYGVRFDTESGAAERLQGAIADDLDADGWTVRRDAPNRGVVSVRFLRDGFSVGAKISDTGNATAGGSGGCVQ